MPADVKEAVHCRKIKRNPTKINFLHATTSLTSVTREISGVLPLSY